MSHTGVEVFDYLLYTIYPVIGIFIVEFISRIFNKISQKIAKYKLQDPEDAIEIPKWIKLWTQAVVSVAFGIYYWFILPAPQNFPLTAMVMFALAIALVYQGRRAKISPDKSPY